MKLGFTLRPSAYQSIPCIALLRVAQPALHFRTTRPRFFAPGSLHVGCPGPDGRERRQDALQWNRAEILAVRVRRQDSPYTPHSAAHVTNCPIAKTSALAQIDGVHANEPAKVDGGAVAADMQ